MYSHDSSDRLGMTFAMGPSLVPVGIVVYIAVRFALGDRDRARRL